MTRRSRILVTALVLLAALPGMVSIATAKAGDYEKDFVAAGTRYHVNPNLLKAVGYRESGISNAPCNSYGYCGVMQISGKNYGDRALDPHFNIAEGSREFASCLQSRDGNVIEAMVCYNAGTGRVYQMYHGQLGYQVVTLDLPVYGRQSGRVPNWGSCSTTTVNSVCNYIYYVIDHFRQFQHDTPYNNGGFKVTSSEHLVAPYKFGVRPIPPLARENAAGGGGGKFVFVAVIVLLLVVARRPLRSGLRRLGGRLQLYREILLPYRPPDGEYRDDSADSTGETDTRIVGDSRRSRNRREVYR